MCVFGHTEEEFLTNLRKVFERFRLKGAKLHPLKSDLGLSETEMCGHSIDGSGIHFVKSKLDSVENFPQPITKKQLKQFIGLANYFREHVPHASDLMRPFNALLGGYTSKDRSHRIRWTVDLITAFETLKAAVCNCQKLYFLDEEYIYIVLRTDASDYGIGAYLLQIIKIDDKEVERPIKFISKSLDATQCKWSTPEKEMFAIWYALKKMHYLLADRKFILETDHKNLTLEKWEGSDKVLRWKLDIQSYDFDIRHKPGVDNIVADGFSRLCEQLDLDYCASLNEDECLNTYLNPNFGEDEPFDELACLELASFDEEVHIPRDIYTRSLKYIIRLVATTV